MFAMRRIASLALALARHDYDSFAEVLLAERRATTLPPFAHLALLTAEAASRDSVDAFLGHAVEQGRALLASHALRCEVYPPVAATIARRAGLERGQVLVQSTTRSTLHDFLPRWRAELERSGPRRVRWNLDVDPLGFT